MGKYISEEMCHGKQVIQPVTSQNSPFFLGTFRSPQKREPSLLYLIVYIFRKTSTILCGESKLRITGCNILIFSDGIDGLKKKFGIKMNASPLKQRAEDLFFLSCNL